MKKPFNNFLNFIKAYPDNESCKAELMVMRWPDKIVCPYCENDRFYSEAKCYKCKNKECGKKFNVFTGTIFENTKVPLPKWFYAIYLFTSHKKGISSHQLAKDIGVTQKTAWFMLGRIRLMLTPDVPLTLSNTIEIDETAIGAKQHFVHDKKLATRKKGTGMVNKTIVFGMLEWGGKVLTRVVTRVDGVGLKPIIYENIEAGARIITDGYGAYNNLDKLPSKNYKHEIVAHTNSEYVRGIYHTNTLEGYWGGLKRGIYGIYHHVSPTHLHRYCDEFAFRWNTRSNWRANALQSL